MSETYNTDINREKHGQGTLDCRGNFAISRLIELMIHAIIDAL